MKEQEIEEIARKVATMLAPQKNVFEQDPKPLKDEQLKKIAKLAISEMMTAWGIDVNNPLEMQEDFAWTRKYRKQAEKVGSAVMLFVALSVLGGIVGLIVNSIWGEK